jgi:GT2 family glycosyltransferase
VPFVTLVVAAHNEASSIDALLEALGATDYPADRLRIVLVDDGSTDGTGARFAAWADGRPAAAVIRLPERIGKHRAQREAMELADGGLVVFCDADVRPRADCLRHLAEPFADETVAGVAGLVLPDNASTSPVARYAAVESWVTQLVTSAGKDRLDLNAPTPGGCCAYRRSALDGIDWHSGDPGADVQLTVALTRAGWRTRFAPKAVAETAVVHRWRDYWHQHVRWARNLFASAGAPAADRRPSEATGPASISRRAEAWVLSAGYSDRLLLLAALPLALTGRLPLRLPAIYLTVTTGEVWTALAKARVGREGHTFFLWTVALFALDIVASVAAATAHLIRWPRAWHQGR